MHPIFAVRLLRGNNQINPSCVSWLLKAIHTQLDFTYNVKRHITENISGREEKQGI